MRSCSSSARRSREAMSRTAAASIPSPPEAATRVRMSSVVRESWVSGVFS